MRTFLILTALFLLESCKNDSHNNQRDSSPMARGEQVDQAHSATSKPIDTLGVFRRILGADTLNESNFGRPIHYSGIESELYINSSYAVGIWDRRSKDEHVTKAYQFTQRGNPDTAYILPSDTLIVEFPYFGQFFMGLDGQYLFMDFGTADGPRGLKILDLAQRDTILEDEYTEIVSYDSTRTIFYFSPFRKATKDDCPKYDEYIKFGLNPYIEQEYSFNLVTRKKTSLEKFRCDAYN